MVKAGGDGSTLSAPSTKRLVTGCCSGLLNFSALPTPPQPQPNKNAAPQRSPASGLVEDVTGKRSCLFPDPTSPSPLLPPRPMLQDGRVFVARLAGVLGVLGAAGHHGQGAALPAHLLQALPGENRQLQERAAVSRVQDPGGLRRGRAAGQHTAGEVTGWD